MPPPKMSQERTRVQATLNAWAPRKHQKGRPSSICRRSVNFVSRPMETKASAKKTLRRLVSAGFMAVTSAPGTTKENSSDAAMKPRTNFGKRAQMTPALALRCWPGAALVLHQTESRKAARPIRTFCENLTIVPIFVAVSPISSPAATTEPVVSSVPPSQAPATMSGMWNWRMSQGWMTIIGTATMRTMDVT